MKQWYSSDDLIRNFRGEESVAVDPFRNALEGVDRYILLQLERCIIVEMDLSSELSSTFALTVPIAFFHLLMFFFPSVLLLLFLSSSLQNPQTSFPPLVKHLLQTLVNTLFLLLTPANFRKHRALSVLRAARLQMIVGDSYKVGGSSRSVTSMFGDAAEGMASKIGGGLKAAAHGAVQGIDR